MFDVNAYLDILCDIIRTADEVQNNNQEQPCELIDSPSVLDEIFNEVDPQKPTFLATQSNPSISFSELDIANAECINEILRLNSENISKTSFQDPSLLSSSNNSTKSYSEKNYNLDGTEAQCSDKRFKILRRQLTVSLAEPPNDTNPAVWFQKSLEDLVNYLRVNVEPSDKIGLSFSAPVLDGNSTWLTCRRADQLDKDAVWYTISHAMKKNTNLFKIANFEVELTS